MPPLDSASFDPYAGWAPAQTPAPAAAPASGAEQPWHPPPGVPVNMVPVIDVGGHHGAATGEPGSEFMPSATGGDSAAPMRPADMQPEGASHGAPSVAGALAKPATPAAKGFDPYAGWESAQPASTASAASVGGKEAKPSAATTPGQAPAPQELRSQPWWQPIWDTVGPGSVFAELPKEIVHGATFGMDEVLGALPGAMARHLIDKEPLGKAFENEAAEMSAGRRVFEANHPDISTGAALAGGLYTAPVTAGLFAPARGVMALSRGQRLLNAARNVGASAGLGAVAGGGMTEGGPQRRLEGAEQGAVLGGVLASAAPAAARAASSVVRPFTRAGTEQTAGRALLESAGGTVPTIERAPIPGMPLDVAQASNSTGLAGLVRGQNGLPGVDADAVAQRTAQNDAIRSAATDMQPNRTRLAEATETPDASAAVVEGMRGAHDVIRQEESRLWQAPALSKPVDLPTINQRMARQVAAMPQRDQQLIEKTDALHGPLADMAGLKPGATLADVNGSRSDLLEAARTDPDPRVRRLAGNLAKGVLQGIETNPALRTDPAAWAAYTRARDFTNRKWDVLGQDQFQAMLKSNRYGRDGVDAGTAARRLFNFSQGSERTPQGIAKITGMLDDIRRQWNGLRLTGTAGFDPATAFAARAQLAQGARNFIVNSMLDAASSITRDAKGNPNVLMNKLSDWIDTNRAWIVKSGLFNSDQIGILDAIREAAVMAQRTENLRGASGSPTYERLAGRRFIDAFLHPVMTRVVGGVAGGLTGLLSEGPVAAGMGMLIGERSGEWLPRLYEAPRQRVMEVLREAIRDPEMARDLMMKATPGTASRISPKTRAAIRGALALLPASAAAQTLTGPAPPAYAAGAR